MTTNTLEFRKDGKLFTSAAAWEKSLEVAKSALGKARKKRAIARRDLKLAEANHAAEIAADGNRWVIASLNGKVIAANTRLEFARLDVKNELMWIRYSEKFLAEAIERETA